ncbi:MAG TPA: amidohydrolase family protein [Acidimicrobiales bacterium]|nr:amidohydrolase family protein [Acidimicrobiales bacterium]
MQAKRRTDDVESDAPWIVDGYVNANPPHLSLDWSLTDDLYGPARVPPQDLAELVADMDRHHIARALLAPPPESAKGDPVAGYRWTLDAVQSHPDRFALSVRVDADQGIRAVRHLERMVRNDGARALRIVPYRDGKRPSHRSYFPLYAKCIELGIPVTVTVGLPVVPREGMVQNPKYLDKVCAFFPELTIVSAHGGAPWTTLLIQLLRTWPNLYHMISAYAPSRYPPELVAFANSRRGRIKMMYASDYPMLTFERTRRELPDCGISEESMPWFTEANAARVFWGEGSAAQPGG